ncbi:MAG: hypothetical protein Q9171_002954 [Xanthocarpia ochracea]
MAESTTLSVKSVEDLDDMIYVSDGDENSLKDCVMQSSAHMEPGMIPGIKSFYLNERDDRTGRYIVTDKSPGNLPEPEETEASARYALVIHYVRCYDGRKNLSISSIVVQSPLLKMALSWVLEDYPCMAPQLDRLEVVSPFRPFVHRWQRLIKALECEQHPETKAHIQLLHDALKGELELTLETRDDFCDHNTITFDALWMIFSPGDIVFSTFDKRQFAARFVDSMMQFGRHEDVYRVECEMIHSNGQSFGWAQCRLDIPQFAGMRRINDLPVYPLKFHPNVDKITQKLIDNGKAYERLLGYHHKQYQGIARDGHQPFYIDSRIIIDAETYVCHNPDRETRLKPLKKVSLPACHKGSNIVQQSDESDSSQEVTEATSKAKKPGPVRALTDEQLMLCAIYVRGYSLRNKLWLDFFVDDVKDINWKESAWDDVVLEKEQKDLVFSLAEGHRLAHEGLRTKGINILICGPGGVGKTFAVESIAESLRAPLFYLTSADVDLDPRCPDLESPFTDLLEMCGRWNAILLFDEANGRLDGDRLDKVEGSEYSMLLRAVESHSAAVFVTCNSAAENCMEDRLLRRFHVTLYLHELTTGMRQTIWQKCLEAHKDIKVFVDHTTLAEWPLNGREIANAVTAAKTLVRNGTLDMKHLERVIPASRRAIVKDRIVEDGCDYPQIAKDKSKKKAKGSIIDEVKEIIDGPAKRDDDRVIWGNLGSKKKNKKGGVDSDSPETFGNRQEQVTKDLGTKTIGRSPTSNWAAPEYVYTSPASSLPHLPVSDETPQAKSKTWDSGAVEDDGGSVLFGTMKLRKGKKASAKEPEELAIPDSLPVPEIDDSCGTWGSKKGKEAKNAIFEEPNVQMVAETVANRESLPLSDIDDCWGSFSLKKAKKAKKAKTPSTNEPEAAVPARANTAAQPLLPLVEVDDWNFWSSSKKTKKGKKKAVVDEPLLVAECTVPVGDFPPAAEIIPVEK